MNSRVLTFLALITLLVASTGTATAQGWGGGSWYGGPWYNSYGMDSMPYYALHPPVYYSYPVPRPYGYSPFAYPPTVRTPELSFVRPKMVRNPFHRPAASPAPDNSASTRPLRIRNPFVSQPDDQLSQAALPEPHVVYPAPGSHATK